jgi:trimeric autotransporter adhesin
MLAAGAGPAGAAAAGAGTPGTGQAATAGIISTVAGGVGGPGPATAVALVPSGVFYGGGSLYIAGSTSVRKVDPGTGHLTTPAGTGVSGPLGDGGWASRANLSGAMGGAVDGAGNLVIADAVSNRVRVVAVATGTFYGRAMKAGYIYTVAGDGTAGFSADGRKAVAAELNYPNGVAVDGAGNLVIADTDNERIRVVAVSTGTFYGKAMTAGDIYTVAGDGKGGFSGDGGPATSAQLSAPTGVAVDGAGNLLIADHNSDRIRVVAVSTGTFYGKAMTAGDIYTVAGNGTRGFSGDGGPATSAELNFPEGVALDGAGNLLIADTNNDRVRVVAATTGTFYGKTMTAGDIYTVAGNGIGGFSGDGGQGTSAELSGPEGVAVDGSGNLVIADTGSDRVRVVASATGTFYGKAMTAGDIYTVAGNGTGFGFEGGPGFSGDGGPATSAEFNLPRGVAVDGAGNLIIADDYNNRVRVVAAATGTFYGQAMTAGDTYTVAGTGKAGFSGDGGPATSARLSRPQGVAVDGAGNLVITDFNNQRVRVVASATGTFYGQAMTAGDIYTVAGDGTAGFSGDGGPATSAELNLPTGVAVDGAGNLVIAEEDNNRVRVVAVTTGTFYGQAMTAGDIYTVAGDGNAGFSGDGGPATSAELDYPEGVLVDGAGNLVIADSHNNVIRVVAVTTGTFYGQAMTAGDIYTVAGDGNAGFSGDGGPATSAEFSDPSWVAVDGAGNLVITDAGNNRVRVVAATTGTFYGQAMTAGDVYTVAGDGPYAFSGDGGPGTSAELASPEGVALDGANLVIVDNGNCRVRMLTG